MFKTLLGDSSFWIAFASALLLSLVAMGATAYAWRNKFSETVKQVELHTEAMRSSINGGITVAALTLPLAISLVAYLLIQLRQTTFNRYTTRKHSHRLDCNRRGRVEPLLYGDGHQHRRRDDNY